jgi:hypothetical protein
MTEGKLGILQQWQPSIAEHRGGRSLEIIDGRSKGDKFSFGLKLDTKQGAPFTKERSWAIC